MSNLRFFEILSKLKQLWSITRRETVQKIMGFQKNVENLRSISTGETIQKII